jgi:uncharacterized membrane protein YeaQ/YmgE (transglycosylase-associated protein family)
MGFIAWIVLGALSGFIAGKIYEGSGNGFLVNTIVGIVGAVVGGFIFNMFGAAGTTGFNIWSLLVSVVGAVAVLWIYNKVAGRPL